MKMSLCRKFVISSVLLGSVLFPALAGADRGGGGSSGVGSGGDVIVLDDRVVLADPFGVHLSDEPQVALTLFSRPILAELARIGELLSAAGSLVSMPTRLGELLDELVLDRDLRYYLASSLPEIPGCSDPTGYPLAPAGGVALRAACTLGDRTWIRPDLFARMSLREQALLLVHEGLRRISPALTDETVFRITGGLAVALDHRNRQERGERTELSAQERSRYLAAVRAIFGLRSYVLSGASARLLEDLAVFPRGGALVLRGAHVGGSSFLGIGVSLSRQASVGEGSEILDSLVCSALSHCLIGDGVRVSRMVVSKGARVVLEEGSRVESSRIDLYSGRSVTLRREAALIGTELQLIAQDLVLESGSSLRSLRAGKYGVGGSFLRKVVGALTVASSAQLDFGRRWLCEGRHNRFQAGVFSSDLVLQEPGQLEEICE